MSLSALEQAALAALDEQELVNAFRSLLRIPSVTGHEAAAQQWLGRHMQELGLEVDLWKIDVAELQQHPQFPGMEVDRSTHEALGLVGIWQGETEKAAAKRLLFNGHIDVVPEGDHGNWQHD
ncbi:MAG: peptidase M20, partial [Ktedonobacteraceae bacterium]